MNNYVDLLVPPVQPGPHRRYEPLDWARANCATYITNHAVQKDGEFYYRFYFHSSPAGDQDRIVFALRWL